MKQFPLVTNYFIELDKKLKNTNVLSHEEYMDYLNHLKPEERTGIECEENCQKVQAYFRGKKVYCKEHDNTIRN